MAAQPDPEAVDREFAWAKRFFSGSWPSEPEYRDRASPVEDIAVAYELIKRMIPPPIAFGPETLAWIDQHGWGI